MGVRTARAEHALIAFGFPSAHVIGVHVHGVLFVVGIALVVRVALADAGIGRGRRHEVV